MVTKSKTGANLEAMSTVERAADETVQQETSLEFLMAEKVRVDAALKAARAAMPQVTKLERVIAKQATQETWLPVNLAKRVANRVKAGQDQETAIKEVFVALEVATRTELEKWAAE
jgi:hypothetical protein